MGKIITYIVYFLVIIAIYVLIRAAFTGTINSDTTIGEATTEVKNGSIETIRDMKNETVQAIDDITKQESSAASPN